MPYLSYGRIETLKLIELEELKTRHEYRIDMQTFADATLWIEYKLKEHGERTFVVQSYLW